MSFGCSDLPYDDQTFSAVKRESRPFSFSALLRGELFEVCSEKNGRVPVISVAAAGGSTAKEGWVGTGSISIDSGVALGRGFAVD